jgi:hypothetical protein
VFIIDDGHIYNFFDILSEKYLNITDYNIVIKGEKR